MTNMESFRPTDSQPPEGRKSEGRKSLEISGFRRPKTPDKAEKPDSSQLDDPITKPGIKDRILAKLPCDKDKTDSLESEDSSKKAKKRLKEFRKSQREKPDHQQAATREYETAIEEGLYDNLIKANRKMIDLKDRANLVNDWVQNNGHEGFGVLTKEVTEELTKLYQEVHDRWKLTKRFRFINHNFQDAIFNYFLNAEKHIKYALISEDSYDDRSSISQPYNPTGDDTISFLSLPYDGPSILSPYSWEDRKPTSKPKKTFSSTDSFKLKKMKEIKKRQKKNMKQQNLC